jgi:DNA repair exonuclease SbcCD nuclease subunit
MPRFIHVSDLHLGFRQYGLVQRFQDYAKTFGKIIEDAIQKQVDFVLVSGDLFHFRNIDPETYIQCLKILEKAKKKNIPVLAIEGNHDFALHRDRISWLRILEEQGVLRLVKLKKGGGLELLGDYFDIGDTRIFGVRYIGYSTKREIESIRKEIDAVNKLEGKKDFTVLMMHFGMEGMLRRKISGEVSLSALQPLRDVVDYLALGHYHMHYEFDDWIFNGGSPDMVSMDEYGQDKGYYYYDADRANFIDTWSLIRPVKRIIVDVTDVEDEIMILTEVQKKVMAEKVSKDALVELVIKGRVDLPRAAFDVGRYQEVTRDKLEALNVNVKLRVEGQQVGVIERELEGLDRREIEETVLKKLLLADERYKGKVELLLPALFDVKDAVMGHKPEEFSDLLHVKLWRLFKEVGGEKIVEASEPEKEPIEEEKTESERPKDGRWF